MVDQHYIDLKNAWKVIDKEPTVWDSIEIKDSSFYYKVNQESILMGSFKDKYLPSSPYSLTLFGKVLAKLSPLANIMSRRPGKEEVTFYALLNIPQSGWLGKTADKKMLEIAAPPLVWRRKQIREGITEKIKDYINADQSFFFLDIGCGAGFDSIEIERLVHRINDLTGNIFNKSYASLNIDIDKKWLKNNQEVTNKLFGLNHHITRENISAFDFFSRENRKPTIGQYENLIVSCNGFAEFLSDIELMKLYRDIFTFTKSFSGNVHIILPFANKNKKQESIGNKIGFHFKSKEKQDFILMLKKIFMNYKLTYCEKYSHIVVSLEKK